MPPQWAGRKRLTRPSFQWALLAGGALHQGPRFVLERLGPPGHNPLVFGAKRQARQALLLGCAWPHPGRARLADESKNYALTG